MDPTDIQDIIVVGAGGHGQIVAEIIQEYYVADKRFRLLGFIDDNPRLVGAVVNDIPVLGDNEYINYLTLCSFVIGIGSNSVRSSLFDQFCSIGFCPVTIRHPYSSVSNSASLGKGVVVCAGAVVSSQAQIGNNVIINTSSSVDHHCTIGDHAHIAPGVRLGGEVVVGEKALVGIGSTVMPGVKIGTHAVVGAGATVIKDVPEGKIVIGTPAK